MSYAMSAALQEAVFNALSGNPVLSAALEGIYDAPPGSGGAPPIGTYITLGDEVAKDRSSGSHKGVTLDFEVNIHSDFAGFSVAKAVAAEVVDTLAWADLGLTRGSLVNLKFLKSRTRRGAAPETRRIALVFRAILDDGSI
ncbi:MAG: DUF3168 domain-containing protein [Rhodobacteraceae bacterium]|nr:DUF3168 domain-containing protein [Paracoccaceae bacterium]